jgi:hypothetical protein
MVLAFSFDTIKLEPISTNKQLKTIHFELEDFIDTFFVL